MSRFIVTYTNPEWRRLTLDPSKDGLGDSYQDVSGVPYEIIFSSDILRLRRDQLEDERVRWTYYSRPSERQVSSTDPSAILRSEYRTTEGDSGRARFRRLFSRRLYRLLYPTKSDYSAATIANYWENIPELGSLSLFEDNTHILSIFSKYIELIDRILAPTQGLSRNEFPAQPAVVGRVPTTAIRKQVPFNFVSIEFVKIPLLDLLQDATTALIDRKAQNYFDQSRERKTFLNFGDHNQYVLDSWRPTRDPYVIQVKTSVPVEIVRPNDPVLIARELAASVVDSLIIDLPPSIDRTPSLRPPNFNVKQSTTSATVVEASLSTLGLARGAVGEINSGSISYEDSKFNRWYTADFNSSELNIDFTNYENFVFYGSAAARVDAFVNKLKLLESIEIRQITSSNTITEQAKAVQIETIKRNFDPYEQFLYFDNTGVAYSASVRNDPEAVEYNQLASWPKQNDGTVYLSTSPQGMSWYVTQSAIASRFDEQNENFLLKHLPQHIREDVNSIEFLAFIAMFGHLMDNIKVYIDQITNIYATDVNPLSGLSMDQVYEVASSFGLDLPNPYEIESLDEFVKDNLPSGLRVSLAETWKRLLHSAILLYKTKGTRESVQHILNAYGISSPLVQIKESAYPVPDNYVLSDEVVYGLKVSSSNQQYVLAPFVSGSVNTETFQLRFKPTLKTAASVLTGDSSWAINIDPYTNDVSPVYGRLEDYPNGTYTINQTKDKYGRITVTSGSTSTIIASSSYFPLYSDDFTTIMLRRTGGDLTVTQTDGEQILYTETVPSNLGTVWNATAFVAIVGSGSMKQATQYQGIIDEMRQWSEYIDDDTFVKHVYDAGAAFGTSYTSSLSSLLTDLTFSQPLPSITSSATNETPNPIRQSFSLVAEGFTTASYQKFTRQTKQYVPMVGSTVYSDNKVIVAGPITPSAQSIDSNGVVNLSRTNSIKPLAEKLYTGPQDQITFAVSPLDYVEQNIRRTMGTVNVNYLIGSPRKIKINRYTELDALFKFYLENYAAQVSPNEYTKFMANAVSAPSEQVRGTVPARATLIDGVVIESPTLYRSKENIVREFSVDGTNTDANLSFESGSPVQIGAYDFTATYDLYPIRDYASIPTGQQVLQYINNNTLVTSSLVSRNSGIAFLESRLGALDTSDVTSTYSDYFGEIVRNVPDVVDTGYPRNPYQGHSTFIDSEVGTIIPFYDIPPSADFSDVGTTTYFHNTTGIYRLPSFVSRYGKELYRVKFAVKLTSVLDQVYAPLTQLPPSTIDFVGRETATISVDLAPNASSVQVIRLARVFLMLGVEAPAGLEITLTRRSDGVAVFSGVTDGSPDLFPYVPVQSGDDGALTCTIRNISGAQLSTNIVFSYYVLENIQLSPNGYLPRHYKFFKDTSVAMRRRNADGCKIIFCPEGCPNGVTPTDTESPVEITISRPTGFVVNRSTTSGDAGTIVFGGRGPLEQ